MAGRNGTPAAARPGADRMRGLGPAALGLLIQYINRREDENRFLKEAVRRVEYGSEAREAQPAYTIQLSVLYSFARLSQSWPCRCLVSPSRPTWPKLWRSRHDSTALWTDLLGVIAGYEGG